MLCLVTVFSVLVCLVINVFGVLIVCGCACTCVHSFVCYFFGECLPGVSSSTKISSFRAWFRELVPVILWHARE